MMNPNKINDTDKLNKFLKEQSKKNVDNKNSSKGTSAMFAMF
jgi:hypothetical protein